MIYATLGMWCLLILLTGTGLYRLWTRYLGGAAVDWLLLPATLVSELAYSTGRLMTGRPAFGGIISPRDPSTDACRVAISGKYGFLVGMLSSLLTIAASVAALGLITKWIGIPAVRSMLAGDRLGGTMALPQTLPSGWGGLWKLAGGQLELLRRTCEGWGRQDWLDWRAPLFVYLSACLAVRLGPVRHDQRASMATALAMVAVLAVAAAMFQPVRQGVKNGFWFLLTYTWAMLLFLLAGTLAIQAAVQMGRILTGRRKTKA